MKKNTTFIATAAWSGYFPVAPGTAGSGLAAIIFLFLNSFHSPAFILAAVLVFVLGIWSATQIENQLGAEDPSIVVIDEVAGMMVSVLFLPVSWLTILLAFILFRIFDILKPPPVRAAEKCGDFLAHRFPGYTIIARNKGGIGIMMDDILAGVYANLVVRIILFFIE